MSEEIEPGRPVVLRGGNVLTTCNRWAPGRSMSGATRASRSSGGEDQASAIAPSTRTSQPATCPSTRHARSRHRGDRAGNSPYAPANPSAAVTRSSATCVAPLTKEWDQLQMRAEEELELTGGVVVLDSRRRRCQRVRVP